MKNNIELFSPYATDYHIMILNPLLHGDDFPKSFALDDLRYYIVENLSYTITAPRADRYVALRRYNSMGVFNGKNHEGGNIFVPRDC